MSLIIQVYIGTALTTWVKDRQYPATVGELKLQLIINNQLKPDTGWQRLPGPTSETNLLTTLLQIQADDKMWHVMDEMTLR